MSKNAECGNAPLSQGRVAAKHHYRFKYLKSEHWGNLRIAKLASVDAKCKHCGARDLSNDVHHLRYRKLYDVELDDLVVLCRICHDLAHEALDLCRTKIKEHDNSWEYTKNVMAIIENGRAFGVDFSFLSGDAPTKGVNNFWKQVSIAKKEGVVGEFCRLNLDTEFKQIKSAISSCGFPEWKFFVFDNKGRKIYEGACLLA